MKEDILEQLADDYLQHLGYFTRHNIKFGPSKGHAEYDTKQDAVYSDIDVIGVNPNVDGPERVMAISCKSWQQGFRPEAMIKAIEENKMVSGREAWRGFRELCREKWASAFIEKVEEVSGSSRFTYVTAITAARGDTAAWECYPPFVNMMRGNPIKVLTLSDMLNQLYPTLEKTPASSDLGRLLQLIKASGWHQL